MSTLPDEPRSFVGLLEELKSSGSGDTVTVGQLLQTVGRRSHGPVLLLLGFISISPLTIIPGANWIVATLTLIFSLQIVFGRQNPWMPGKLLGFKFKREHLEKGVESMRIPAEILDEVLEARLTFLTGKPFIQFVALICVGAALITYPLGFVPFGPLLPGLTILLFAIGLTSKDGGMIILASASFGGAILVMVELLQNWNQFF